MNADGFWRKRLDALLRWWNGRAPEEHERQLEQLYWNRAELKKALAKREDELHALQAKLRKNEDARRRAEDQLQRLQQYLGDPASGAHALVYFRLRALWRLGADMLTQFGSELARLQEEQERRKHQAEYETTRARALAKIDDKLNEARTGADTLAARIGSIESRCANLRPLWHYFRRRELLREIAALRSRLDAAQVSVNELSDEYAAATGEPLPEFRGMSVAGRRLVNTAVIAYAEWLIGKLPKAELALLAHTAMQTSVYDALYGNAQECERLMQLSVTAMRTFAQLDQHSSELGERTAGIRARAAYGSTVDTVPNAVSIGEIVCHDAAPAATATRLIGADPASHDVRFNVLLDDYWGVCEQLLR